MFTPNEALIAHAIGLLEAAQSKSDIPDAAESLAVGLGLERFVILDIHCGEVRWLYHNAPAGLHAEVSDLDVLSADHVLRRAHSSNVPFVWDSGENGWRLEHGDFGYRSGVAAAIHGSNGPAATVILSGTADRTEDAHEMTLRTYALMAAVMLNGAFRRFAVAAPPVLTQRELDCLLYDLVGKSAKETARALGIEPRTVRQYLERARSKLGTTTSYAAAMTALRNGWLDMGQALELAGLASPGTRGVLGAE